MSKYLKYYLAFSHFLGIGPIKFKQLITGFGNPENAYQAETKKIVEILGPKLTEKFNRFRLEFKSDSILKNLFKKNIQVLTLDDEYYPNNLRQISDPPICLYLLGEKKVLKETNIIAIVGTRKPTSYGQEVTEKFTSELAQYGFVVVSGLALGIDSIAHWSAIKNNAKTIAVLGCGVDIVYPPSNKTLYYQIIKSGGVIVSEFPPGHTVLKGLFVARNRIISGLARGVLVIEGTKDSGSLITARYAAEQGKDVFAPPSPITSPLSQAPNILLKQGAKLVTSVSDILEEYQIRIKTKDKQAILEKVFGLEKEIMEMIIAEAKSADELSFILKKPINQILNSLSLLEIQGLVKKNTDGKFYSFL